MTPVIAASEARQSMSLHAEARIASSLLLLAMTAGAALACYRTTPEVNPALRRGGLISFFRKQCGSRPA
jgi:hypothetical protein